MFRLPVFATAGSGYRFVVAERAAVARLAFPAVVVLSLLETGAALLLSYGPAGGTDGAAVLRPALGLAVLTAEIFAMVTFSVAVARRCLLAGEDGTVGAALVWRSRHWAYLRRLGVLLAVAAAVALPAVASLLPELGSQPNAAPPAARLWPLPFTALGAGYVTARLSFLLPAAAIDAELGIHACWRLSAGNGWRLFALTVLASLPVPFAGVLFGQMLDGFALGLGVDGTLSHRLAQTLLDNGLAFAGLAVAVAAMALAYRAFVAARH